MNATWITLAVVLIVGVTKFFSYYLGKDRQLRILKEEEHALLEALRRELARNNAVLISIIEFDLKRLRKQIRDISGK